MTGSVSPGNPSGGGEGARRGGGPETESGPGGAAGGGFGDQAFRLLSELREDRHRLRRMLFWLSTLALAVFLALMVFFILYLDESRRNVESSLAQGLPGLGREMAGIVRTELDDGMKLQEEIAGLQSRNAGLREDLARAEKEIQLLKRKEMDHLRLLDQRRVELGEKQRMYEELVARFETSGGEDGGWTAGEESGGDASKNDGTVTGDVEAKDFLRALNEFLERSGQSAVRIAGYEEVGPTGLLNPTVSVRNFDGAASAVLLPGRLVISRTGEQVRIWNEGPGTCTPLGAATKPLEERAFDLTFTAAALDEIVQPSLRGLLGMAPLPEPEPEADPTPVLADGPGDTDVLTRLNRLLEQERGRQFRFAAVQAVEDSALCSVRFDTFDTRGILKSSVEARKCRFKLYSRDRYIEVQFEDGHIVQDKKRTPFYQNQYRLTLPDIDVKAWQGADFEFLEEV